LTKIAFTIKVQKNDLIDLTPHKFDTLRLKDEKILGLSKNSFVNLVPELQGSKKI
jgi:hypothetical protein